MHRKVPAWFGPGAVGKGAAPSGNLANGLPVLLGRIRGLNRLELAWETVRAALEALAAAAPDWLAAVIDTSWQQVYGQRADQIRLPASDTARAKLAVQYGTDGYHLLEAACAPGAPDWLRELPAVQALRAVWVQQYYRSTGEQGQKVIRREADEHGLPPGRARLVWPYDPDARYSEKHGRSWLGYKVHLSETCTEAADDDPATGRPPAPNLLTGVATTEASIPDVAMTAPIHHTLTAADLTPAEHTVDAGYTSADLLLAARAQGITLLGPLLADTSPQARTGGYTAEAFTIDWNHQQVTCPQGATSVAWSPCRQRGTDAIVVKFAAATCQACPAKNLCTRSTRSGRQLTLRPREVHQAVTDARAGQTTDQWKTRYNIRAGVEGTIRQATHVTGIRRARYLGLPKTRLEHNAAAAVNLIRLDAWWTGKPLDRTRTTHLQRLDLTLASLNPISQQGRCAPQTSLNPPGWSWRALKRRNSTGSSRIPSRIRATLRKALNDAIRRGLITTNPATHLELPSGRRPRPVVWTPERVTRWRTGGAVPSPVMVWTPEQAGRFLDTAAGDRLYTLFHLVAYRGLRRGEACGLHWTDLNLDAGTLTVSWQIVQHGWATELKTPKTDGSERTVALDAGTITALRDDPGG